MSYKIIASLKLTVHVSLTLLVPGGGEGVQCTTGVNFCGELLKGK